MPCVESAYKCIAQRQGAACSFIDIFLY